MNEKCPDQLRRRFCQAGLALGAVAILPACGGSAKSSAIISGDGGVCGTNTVAVGNVSDVAVNDAILRQTPTTDVFICHDAAGFYAVDAGCTHFGCDVGLKAAKDLTQGFLCPCHGATYDAQGENPTTPAPSPLPHYSLCLEDSGTLVVDLDVNVDASFRLKP
jgi:thiosulfate dehydrogenase [quinone] large subunit